MAKIWDVTARAPHGWWVIDDKSGARLESNSYRNLKNVIISHRKANNLEWLNHEVEDMIHRQVCARESSEYCRDIKNFKHKPAYPNASSKWGPGKWAELHRAALRGEFNPTWYQAWVKSLPNAGCGCRREWNHLTQQHAVQYTFAWTVFMHNQVSKRLGKPQITEDQARAIWS